MSMKLKRYKLLSFTYEGKLVELVPVRSKLSPIELREAVEKNLWKNISTNDPIKAVLDGLQQEGVLQQVDNILGLDVINAIELGVMPNG